MARAAKASAGDILEPSMFGIKLSNLIMFDDSVVLFDHQDVYSSESMTGSVTETMKARMVA